MTSTYALESRKRKFDKILESLSTPQSPQVSSTTVTSTNISTRAGLSSSSSRSTLSDSLKRRRLATAGKLTSSTSTILSTPESLQSSYLPSSRPAYLARLETFRHVTKWHVPSTGRINASRWAARGWCCVERDTVGCGSCRERMRVDLEPGTEKENVQHGEQENTTEKVLAPKESRDEAEEDLQTQIHEALVTRYEEMIVTAHAEGCPWRKRGCDSSIQRIDGLLSTNIVHDTTKKRYEGLMERSEEIPQVIMTPDSSTVSIDENVLQSLDIGPPHERSLDSIRLAICGWQRKDTDVISCEHCFRSLGLWLYRGDEPAVEHLDAIESHLEYCPWRSPEAQDTEVPVPIPSSTSGRPHGKQPVQKCAGWLLTYLALARLSAKKKGGAGVSSISLASGEGEKDETTEMSPEQREKRMRDLVKRIKEIRRPFNVKALLKKKGGLS